MVCRAHPLPVEIVGRSHSIEDHAAGRDAPVCRDRHDLVDPALELGVGNQLGKQPAKGPVEIERAACQPLSGGDCHSKGVDRDFRRSGDNQANPHGSHRVSQRPVWLRKRRSGAKCPDPEITCRLPCPAGRAIFGCAENSSPGAADLRCCRLRSSLTYFQYARSGGALARRYGWALLISRRRLASRPPQGRSDNLFLGQDTRPTSAFVQARRAWNTYTAQSIRLTRGSRSIAGSANFNTLATQSGQNIGTAIPNLPWITVPPAASTHCRSRLAV